PRRARAAERGDAGRARPLAAAAALALGEDPVGVVARRREFERAVAGFKRPFDGDVAAGAGALGPRAVGDEAGGRTRLPCEPADAVGEHRVRLVAAGGDRAVEGQADVAAGTR